MEKIKLKTNYEPCIGDSLTNSRFDFSIKYIGENKYIKEIGKLNINKGEKLYCWTNSYNLNRTNYPLEFIIS